MAYYWSPFVRPSKIWMTWIRILFDVVTRWIKICAVTKRRVFYSPNSEGNNSIGKLYLMKIMSVSTSAIKNTWLIIEHDVCIYLHIYIYTYNYIANSCHKATKDTCLSCLMLGLLQDIIYLSSHEQFIPSKLDLQVTKKCLFRPADNTRKDLWYPYLLRI